MVDTLSKYLKKKPIYLYFTATKYIYNKALVEYIATITQSYSLVIMVNRSHKPK